MNLALCLKIYADFMREWLGFFRRMHRCGKRKKPCRLVKGRMSGIPCGLGVELMVPSLRM